jgi:FKBP-type peptidyl-prolyl cis-trans isomerase FklB
MKRQLLAVMSLGLACGLLPVAAQTPTPAGQTNQPTDFSKIFKTDKEKLSYAVGMNFGSNLKATLKRAEIESEMDMDVVTKAFRDSLSGTNTLITEDQEKEILMAYQSNIESKQADKRKQQADKNLAEGTAFLDKNKNQTGIITTASGLQYKVMTPGAGDSPKATDTVSVNYRGTLIDGTEFDSSYKRGRPAEFPVMGVIKGWSEALQLMKPGAKWQLFVPSGLAYRESGNGAIGPNATLIFEVELLSVKPPAPAASGGGMASTGKPLTSDIVKVPSAEEMAKGAKIETIKASDLEQEKAKMTNK